MCLKNWIPSPVPQWSARERIEVCECCLRILILWYTNQISNSGPRIPQMWSLINIVGLSHDCLHLWRGGGGNASTYEEDTPALIPRIATRAAWHKMRLKVCWARSKQKKKKERKKEEERLNERCRMLPLLPCAKTGGLTINMQCHAAIKSSLRFKHPLSTNACFHPHASRL